MKKDMMRRLAFVLVLATILGYGTNCNVADAKASVITVNTKGSLPEGFDFSKKLIKKVINVKINGKAVNFSLKKSQIGKPIVPSKKCTKKVILRVNGKSIKAYVKVNYMTDLYVKPKIRFILTNGSAFSEKLCRNGLVVMAEYQNGKKQKFKNYKIKAAKKVVAKNGFFPVTIWYKAKNEKFEKTVYIPVVTAPVVPTVSPTEAPEEPEEPTVAPSAVPTAVPTVVPTIAPTAVSTAVPTVAPTAVSTAVPTVAPTAVSTAVPTVAPTAVPTVAPTAVSTAVPTIAPTAVSTAVPTVAPTAVSTAVPTVSPTTVPTAAPTAEPTTVTVTYRHENGQILLTQAVTFGEGLLPPTENLWQANRTFDGWQIGGTVYHGSATDREFYDKDGNLLSDKIETLTAEKKDVDIVSYFIDDPAQYYSVTVKGGEIVSFDGEQNDDGFYKDGSQIVIQPVIPDGMYFAGWFDEEGNLITTDLLYNPFVHSKLSFTAKFSEKPVEKKPVTSFTGEKYKLSPENHGVTLFLALELPEGFERVSWHIMYAEEPLSEEDFVLKNNDVQSDEIIPKVSGSTDWKYYATLYNDTIWESGGSVYFRAVLYYSDSNGTTHATYSPVQEVSCVVAS